MRATIRNATLVALLVGRVLLSDAAAQPLGIEMQNMTLPASGGMGGVSIAQPQEILAAINGNPATVTRFDGTQFQFGGGWAEPTYVLNQTGTLRVPGVTPFNAKSQTPGTALVNIGLNQRFCLAGYDANFGLGLFSNAGGGVDFRKFPTSNGTSSNLLILEVTPAFGIRVTDRLSVGASASLGNGYFDGPFVGDGAMTQAYGLRGSFGANFDLNPCNTLGAFWQSKQDFHFQDAVSLQLFNGAFSTTRDINMDLPQTVGFGIANRALCDGRLLLGVDLLYKNWENADLFKAIYRDQWALQVGSQYCLNRLRLRAGYVYALNPIKQITSTEAGGVVPPGGVNAVEYVQAQLATINEHRISTGVGVVDVVPGLDVDMHVGGMLPATDALGQFTGVSLKSYWIGLGATYRFGRMTR